MLNIARYIGGSGAEDKIGIKIDVERDIDVDRLGYWVES